jgi:hypothetical protein
VPGSSSFSILFVFYIANIDVTPESLGWHLESSLTATDRGGLGGVSLLYGQAIKRKNHG